MSCDTLQHAIQLQNEYMRYVSGTQSCSSDGAAMSSRRVSLTCPNCRASVVDIPEDIHEVDEENVAEPSKGKRWSKRPNFISRPIKRKESDTSTLPGSLSGSTILGFDIDGPTPKHLRRTSVSSEASDSSSQTRVEPLPPPRSILTHSPSVSSRKSGKSTLTAKRSVKFSDEPVYYDYTYRDSRFCTCPHPPHQRHHAPFCKLPYDCNGECLFDDYRFSGYDDDMFSFELPEEIPSERRWGILSHFVAWFRRMTGGRMYTIEEGKRRPIISRPQPLAPRPCRADASSEKRKRRRIRKRPRNPPRALEG